MLRPLFALVGLVAVVGLATAQVAPKKPDDKTLVTKTYDLRPVLSAKASGASDVDAVIKLILDTLPLGELKPGTDGPQLIEREGGKLEVRATAAVQGEIGDLIEALVRLLDVAVDVKAEVIEFDTATFEKLTKVLSKVSQTRPGSPVLLATGEEEEEKELTPDQKQTLKEANQLLKGGKVIQKGEVRHSNGAEGTISARQSVMTYKNQPDPNWFFRLGQPATEQLHMKEGFKLVGLPVVSADRRFIRLKLTEQSVVVTGIRKRDLGEHMGVKIIAQSPVTEDLGATGSAVVADGGKLVFRLAYAPKDKVWLVVMNPTIYIQAEEDARKKGS